MKRWTIISVLLIALLAACGGAPAPAGGAVDSAQTTLFANFTTVETESGEFYQIDPPMLAEGLKSKNL